MNDLDHETLASINYYCREGYYGHMEGAVKHGLSRTVNDPVLMFFLAFSKVLQNRVQEGIRDLEVLKDKRDINLCSTIALMFAHKRSSSLDREAVMSLDSKLKEERKQAGEMGLYFAGLFLTLYGKHEKAREYIDRMLKMVPSSVEALTIKGWIELKSGKDVKKSLRCFDEALKDGMRNIDAVLGKIELCKLRHNYSSALELVNHVVVSFPVFVPGYIEKMKLQLALQDWDQVLDTAQRCQIPVSLQSHENMAVTASSVGLVEFLTGFQDAALLPSRACFPPDFLKIVVEVKASGPSHVLRLLLEASRKIEGIISSLDRMESSSSHIYSNLAHLFSALCGSNASVLQQTLKLAQRAVSVRNDDADLIVELGSQLLMAGKTQEAARCFQNAMKVDESNVLALTGIIRCQLLEDRIEEASQQLEFMNELKQTLGRSAELSYLSSVLATKKSAAQNEITDLLNEAVELHFSALNGVPLSAQYYTLLQPYFLVRVVNGYLQFAPQEPVKSGTHVSPVLKRCHQVLEPLTRAVPGLIEGLYLISKVKYLAGEFDSAHNSLQQCLDRDPTFSDAYILMAQIHLHENNPKLAGQCLEVGLSHQFEVRDHPLYHLLRAQIAKKQGDVAEALQTLKIAMTLPGVKCVSRSNGKQISTKDRVSVFLELVEAHRLMDEQHEAAKVMQDAINEFKNTAEEVRIAIANADLSLARGGVESALGLLRGVQPTQTYYVEAVEKMADIYLNYRKDKTLYASCYRELVDKQPNAHTCLLLGDAYMNIQEPERAMEVYEAALRGSPSDPAPATKIGQALVNTHHYGKAIKYYEASLEATNQPFLRYDLAELFVKLHQYEKAENVLVHALDSDSQDLETLIHQVKYTTLLAKVYLRLERVADAVDQLTKARDVQTRVVKRAQTEQPDILPSQKQIAASICSQLAYQAANQREFDRAIRVYKDALVFDDSDTKAMLALANVYQLTDDLDACQHQLMTLLTGDKDNDPATIMLADVLFRRKDYDLATHHLHQLLQRNPGNYPALARIVDLLRRAGKLDEVPPLLGKAKSSSISLVDAGLSYCCALYEWYSGKPTEALKLFNKARRNTEWGQQAVYNMIQICLHPDNETIGGEVVGTLDGSNGQSDRERVDSDQMAVRTAERLLKEVRSEPGDVRFRLLESMALVATKQRQNVERALSSFMEICSNNEGEQVGALYGMAVAYMVLKQTPRARNQLKRITKATWTTRDAEDLEKSWLLLADIYIQSGKYDMASDLLNRCLQYNKSCCKAYEHNGFIMEKEQAYKDAAVHYESAWKFSSKNNPVIGYKLAFNYLKANRYVDAIDICHHVLDTHPNYPKIKKDILEKARSSIRV